LSSKLQFRWLENKWNASSKKLKLLLTWQTRVSKIETQAAHALITSVHLRICLFIDLWSCLSDLKEHGHGKLYALSPMHLHFQFCALLSAFAMEKLCVLALLTQAYFIESYVKLRSDVGKLSTLLKPYWFIYWIELYMVKFMLLCDLLKVIWIFLWKFGFF